MHFTTQGMHGEKVGATFTYDGYIHCVLSGLHAKTHNETRGFK